jgi:hypothetical protein
MQVVSLITLRGRQVHEDVSPRRRGSLGHLRGCLLSVAFVQLAGQKTRSCLYKLSPLPRKLKGRRVEEGWFQIFLAKLSLDLAAI